MPSPRFAFSGEWDSRINRANQATGGGTGTGGRTSEWLALARDSFYGSSDFMNANIRRDWEDAFRAFNNRHVSGSKYFSEEYRHKSKLFRPKTRAAIRKSEAAAAAAFFSRADAVNIAAANDSDPEAKAAADFIKQVVNHRLGVNGASKDTIRWFLTVMGAWQSATITGVCLSKQFWEYAEAPAPEPVDPDEVPTDEVKARKARDPQKLRDRPVCRLLPPENGRIDPGADWIDPINSSPYFIEVIPMFVVDVLERMARVDDKTGQPDWKPLEANVLKAATTQTFDLESTRQARENYRQDSKDQGSITRVGDYEIVWVHENIVRKGGQDWIYYTLGVHEMLSEPKPLQDVYAHCDNGERPYVMGYRMIEAHKTYPTGVPNLMGPIQQEINEVANARVENVKLAVNGRVVVRRGDKVDLKALRRHIAGGIVLAQDPEKDVKFERPPDVTRSSYEEQDRLSVEADDLTGGFAQSSVLNNRKLNETVGGMKMLDSSGNALLDYDVRVFGETWMEPVIRQFIRLEQKYETDHTIMALASKRAKIDPAVIFTPHIERLFNEDLVTSINVGVGFANPEVQLERFAMALKMVAEVIGEEGRDMLDVEEIIAEVFSKSGYKDGMRFFKLEEDSPEMVKAKKFVEQVQQEMQELEKKAAGHEIAAQSRVEVAKINQETDLREAEIRAQLTQEVEDARIGAQKDLEYVRGDQQMSIEQAKQGGAMNMHMLQNPETANQFMKVVTDKLAAQQGDNAQVSQAVLDMRQITEQMVAQSQNNDQMAAAVMQVMQMVAQNMAATQEMMGALTQAITAPKKVIRDAKGKVSGVETAAPAATPRSGA